MSEQQKLFASVSGALVAHAIFLMAIFVLLTTRSVSRDSNADDRAAAPQPQEVSVMMSDLMENLEREKAEPVPMIDPKTGRKFVSTKANQEEAEKPGSPRFESDRNTTAASRLQPDELLPQEAGPTLVGAGSDSDLTLDDQKYSEGEIDRNPSSQSGKGAGSGPSQEVGAISREDERKEKIYVTQSDSGEAAPVPDEVSPAARSEAGGGNQGDDGFSEERREDDRNGKATKEGENAVDAEKTAMGEYKQAVRDAVAKKWHLYRAEKEGTAIWGMIKLTFRVDPNGEVQELQITKNEANATLLDISLRAIRESDLPPMPPEVAEAVGEDGLEIRYDIITY
ncbi:MAG: hypothetical protein P1U86_10260 [Verrucomicrobiales bacterium]|nr:hypothetical protein [Verrucomicrobiales bacterium]